MERSYRNIGYILLSFVPIFVAGFWIPYFAQIPHFDTSITAAVHAHAVLLFGWLGLLVVQPLLIRRGAFTIHRVLGKLSYVLMPLVVLSALAMIWKEYHEKLSEGASAAIARDAEFLFVTQLLLLGTLYCFSIAYVWKHKIGAHMRCMICIALVLLPAGLARVLGYWFYVRQAASQTVCLSVIDASLIGLIIYDKSRKANPWLYAMTLAAYLLIEAVWFGLGRPI